MTSTSDLSIRSADRLLNRIERADRLSVWRSFTFGESVDSTESPREPCEALCSFGSLDQSNMESLAVAMDRVVEEQVRVPCGLLC
jgi:hypothetical protein